MRLISCRRRLTLAALLLGGFLLAPAAWAFCGFYVAKADTQLFNQASKVVLVRDGDRTVLTMANDYQGDPKEFAIVVPVPTFLEREQIHVGDRAVIEHLDAYSAPRLVEYFDPDPCHPPYPRRVPMSAAPESAMLGSAERRDQIGDDPVPRPAFAQPLWPHIGIQTIIGVGQPGSRHRHANGTGERRQRHCQP